MEIKTNQNPEQTIEKIINGNDIDKIKRSEKWEYTIKNILEL